MLNSALLPFRGRAHADGANQPMDCAACDADNPSTALFCVKCGAALAGRCSQCQAEVPPTARFCPGCGQPIRGVAPSAPVRPAERPPTERRQVTVLFADFAGFTAFSHKRDAEDVRDYIGSVWARLDRIIEAHGGLVEKHIGDAIMALFGARRAREDDPTQAVRAALAIQACLAELKSEPGGPELQMRIGVHTGLVVVGPLGPGDELTATGETVNLASRLEKNAPAEGVLVSQETYRQIHGLFDAQAQPPLQVSGLLEPVQTYLILRARPRWLAAQLRGIEGVEVEMVGREREVERLQAALRQVMETKKSMVITIVGEAGIGKSRLWRAFQDWMELVPDAIRFFFGRATAESATLPYAVVRNAFCARFEIQDSDPPGVARDKLERGIASLLEGVATGGACAQTEPDQMSASAEDARVSTHFIGQLLGLDFSASPWLRDILGDANQIRQRAFRCFSGFFSTISRGASAGACSGPVRAVVLAAEDVQWADDGSLDLLEHLSRDCRDVPLLVVCLARPTLFERRATWGEGLPCSARVDLEPLSHEGCLALVDSILRKVPGVPTPLRELIVSGAEGIPFYIEEMIKMFIDQRVIATGDDQWLVESERLGAARVPSTLTGILQARLDGLTSVERRVMQRGAVVGRVFWDSAVEHLGSTEEPPLTRAAMTEALDGLRAKELVFRRDASAFAGTVEYSFKHELLRNVAYESLLKKLRRNYHAEIAEWLIQQSGERVGEFAGLVAGHFERGARETQAAAWYGRAGQEAHAAYAPAPAIGFFRKALALAKSAASPGKPGHNAATLLEWQEGLVEALGAQARFEEGVQACIAQRQMAEAAGDSAAQARAWNNLAYLKEREGKNRASVECAERAEALAREAGEAGKGERIRALLLKGWASYRLSDAAAVLALGDEARRLCLDCGNRSGLATSHKLHGVAHLQLGHFGEADRFFQDGLVLYQELGDRRNMAAMLSNLGESARMRGNYVAAEALYEQALAEVRRIGHRDSEVIYLTNLSAARLGLEKFALAESEALEAIRLTDGTNFCVLSEAYSFLSEARLGQGRHVEARADAQRALAAARDSENDLDLGTAWRALGRVAVALNPDGAVSGAECAQSERVPLAEDCFAEGLRVFEKINAAGEQACTFRYWAEYECRRGRHEDARRLGQTALGIFEQLGAEPEVARTAALLQELARQGASA
jgi:class 3 adenylate cyclase/tetratricopeptide (TPR) repeat protein